MQTITLVLLLVIAIVAFGIRIHKLYRIMRLGQYDNRFDKIYQRIKSLFVYVICQKRILDELYPGILHLFIFWGFIIICFGTLQHFGKGFSTGFRLPVVGNNYYFYLLLDIFGVLVSIGVLMAGYRRLIIRPERLKNHMLDGLIILALILMLMITMFITNAAEILLHRFPIEPIPPVSLFLSTIVGSFELHENTLDLISNFSWWLDSLILLGFLVYIPFSKHLHLIAAIPNVFLRSLHPKGVLKTIELEEAESYGVAKIQQYTWKQLLDLYACTECGRCQDNCPSYLTDKPLSSKKFIQNLRAHLIQHGAQLINRKNRNTDTDITSNLIGNVVSEEEIWACTTCGACQEVCPVFIEHIDKTIDLRRNLVLMESRFPSEVQTVFRNMENNFNPWALGYTTRAEWIGELKVPILSETDEVELLFWVGCAGAFDDRNKKIARNMVKVLNTVGINYGILGVNEKCCGDSARRIGNEYLAYTLIESNIETLANYKFKRILTTCPHCYNCLKNEYPQFNASFDVVHHTEFIVELINTGRLKFNKSANFTVVYHDSCYLGRYNNIFTQPRQIITSIPQVKLVEMRRRGTRSLCCGAGGGRMWMEELLGTRINELRTSEALELNPDFICTACPFCLTMFEDAIKSKEFEERTPKTVDLIELVEQYI